MPATPPITRSIFTGRMAAALIMGFASGLPLLLTMGVLQAWMRDAGRDLAAIGLINLVQIPYTWKFIWAPLMDRFTPAILGRRRGWLMLSQAALTLSIVALAFSNPGGSLLPTVVSALMVAFFSATQDIVVDAYRRESLSDDELGLGSSLYIYGYRMGMLLSSGGGLILADRISWTAVYLVMAGCMIPAMVVTLLAPEPRAAPGQPKSLRDAVTAPLIDYFTRPAAFSILAFILLYKLGDSMASAMTLPFYLDIGFTKTQVGAVVKIFGTAAVIVGSILGGVIMLRLGIHRSLWIFGALQAVSTAGFAVLAQIGNNVVALSGVIAFENISSGMGTAAFVAFMASITDKRFTATQYALLSSLMGIPRVLAAAPTGYMAQMMGWPGFFIFCTLIAVPGMMLLVRFAPWSPATNPPSGER